MRFFFVLKKNKVASVDIDEKVKTRYGSSKSIESFTRSLTVIFPNPDILLILTVSI